jgi:hypothetical protein
VLCFAFGLPLTGIAGRRHEWRRGTPEGVRRKHKGLGFGFWDLLSGQTSAEADAAS